MVQALTQHIHRHTYEVFDDDAYTYVPGEAKVNMWSTIAKVEVTLNQLKEDLSPHLPVDPFSLFIG